MIHPRTGAAFAAFVFAFCAWQGAAQGSPAPAKTSPTAPAAGTTAVPAKPLVRPAFTDEEGLREYVKKASLEERLKLYTDYLVSRPLNAAANHVIAERFEADLGATTPEKRKSLAEAVIRTAKSPGLSENALAYFGEFLAGLPAYPESAAIFYPALPIQARSSGLGHIELDAKRVSVLLGLMPGILPKLKAQVRSDIFTESLDWCEYNMLGYGNADFRKLSLVMAETSTSLFESISPADAMGRNPNAQYLLKNAPTEKEEEYFLPLFFEFAKSVALDEPVTLLVSRYGDRKKNAETEKFLAAARDSKNERTRTLARYLLFLEKGPAGTQAGKEAWPAMSAIPGIADDWVAFAAYRVASSRGEKLSDDELLLCLDPKRPSLAAAVLEDRFGADYYSPGFVPAGTPQKRSAFEEAALKKCLALAKVDSERVLVPVLESIIHLGKATYLNAITFYISGPFPSLREFNMLTLLRFGDKTHFSFFMDRLYDENYRIRMLAIEGLGKLRDSRAVDPLAKIVGDTEESMVIRISAAEALGEIGDRRMVRIFMNILVAPASGDDNLRIYAARSLGEQKEKTAVNALLQNIVPTGENDLNYYCLEALGKIEDPEGFRKLVPILGTAWKKWFEGEERKDNFYAALWALFTYKSPDLERICAEAFGPAGRKYSADAFIAAYYLVRQTAAPKREWLDYCDAHHLEFFRDSYRPYQFAVMLDGKWDDRSVGYLADGLENYDDSTLTWVLSGMNERPSLAFIPRLRGPSASEDETVRRWAGSVAKSIAELIPASPPADSGDPALAAGRELLSIVDAWLATEKDQKTRDYLTKAATRLATYRQSAAP